MDMTNSYRPVVLDLFCGAGGMGLGFELAGYAIGLGIDQDPLACQTHAYNFNSRTVCKDLQEITDPLAFLQEFGVQHVDAIIGGPPCQGFSRVGRGKLRTLNQIYTQDARNQLYKQYIRFVEAVRPAYFVIENVPDMGKYLDGEESLLGKIRREFSNLGYLTDERILSAADFGVPQLRKRLFIVGNRLNQAITWPEPTHGPNRPLPYLTVWQAISDLPVIDIKHRQDEMIYEPRGVLNEYQSLMRKGCDNMLYNHQTRWHNPQDLEAFTWMPEGGKVQRPACTIQTISG